MKTVEDLERKLAEPSECLIRDMSELDGDIMIVGIGGKMGPSLARLAVNAIREAGVCKQVIGVSRFSDRSLKNELEASGVKTIAMDLLNENKLQELPDVKNLVYMAGTKFGTTGNESFTWAMNSYLPGRVAEKFRNSRNVVFSTGNVYPLTPVKRGGALTTNPTGPIGEYAQSCLGRERIFEYFSRLYQIPMTIYRLNYAIDMRYGVLVEIAKAVKAGTPIDVTMGHANVIWQGDANEMALRALTTCSTPPTVLNVTGPETISLRWVAEEFADRFGVKAEIVGEESDTALLSNAAKTFSLFGYPRVSLYQMMGWIAEWVANDGISWNKPTHFQEREGNF